MAIEMEYLSHSRLDVFRQCPRLFFKRYIEKAEPENPTTDYFGQYGTNLHYLSEMWFKNRGLMPKQVLVDWFINGTEDEDGNEIVGFDKMAMPDRMKMSYYDSGLSYIDRLVTYDTSKTIGVEQEFWLEVAPGIPPVKGYIDRLDRTEHGLVVIDYKTSRPYPQEKADVLPQVSIYGLAVYQDYGEYPCAYRYIFIRVNDEVVTYRTPEQLEQTRLEIIDLWRQINESDWEPRYDSFYCNNFCPHNVSCPLYQEMKSKGRGKRK
jgi:RecB family exonuclease